MTTLREAAQQALQALEDFKRRGHWGDFDNLTGALKAALEADDGMYGAKALTVAYENGWNAAKAEPVQEPGWVCPDSAEHRYQKPGHCEDCGKTLVQERNFCPRCGKRTNGIHTCTPPAPLTDEVIAELWHQNGGFHHHFARAIERWLKGNP